MKKDVYVFLNNQHGLLPGQIALLDKEFGDDWQIVPIPEQGWTLEEMQDVASSTTREGHGAQIVVFASPVPYLIMLFSYYNGFGATGETSPVHVSKVMVFHNDRRDKKELPNGKVIYTVAKTGWQLVG